MKVLIIEDEINAAKELERIFLNQETTIEVLAILDSVEAVEFLEQKNPPDLIFSDIQLADGMCFEIYKAVTVRNPVVFCTAFDEYILEAFGTNAVSYLLKPITEEAVGKALEKFKQLKFAFDPAAVTRSIKKLDQQLNYAYKKSLLVE